MILTILNILLSLFSVNNNIEENIDNCLYEYFPECTRIEYTIVSPQNIDLSQFQLDNNRELKLQGSYAYLPVKEFNSNGISKNTIITLKLNVFKKVLVANRDIKKKQYLNLQDFHYDEKEILSLRYPPADILLPVDDYRSRRNIKENSVLQISMLEKIPDIEVGDRVEAVFNNSSVNISFNVTARSEGVAGSIIKVKRDDRKIFKAQVINNSTVKIIE
jgi:flagella basal body P-ring formation protein FlgA